MKNFVIILYVYHIANYVSAHWQESWSGGSSTSEADQHDINRLEAEISALNKSLQLELGNQSDTEQVSSQVISWWLPFIKLKK